MIWNMLIQRVDEEQTPCPNPAVKEHTITFTGAESFRLREDKTLLEGLQQSMSIEVTASCGGFGKCKKCTVTVMEGPITEVGRDSVARDYDIFPDTPRDVLSCRTMARGDIKVELKRRGAAKIEGLGGSIAEVDLDPLFSKYHVVLPRGEGKASDIIAGINEHLGFKAGIGADVARELQAFASGESGFTVTIADLPEGREIIRVERGDTVASQACIAVDIGTTTVACALIDPNSGALLAESSMYNGQKSMGDDVISRISYCRNENGLRNLQAAVLETVNSIVEEAARKAGIDVSRIDSLVVSGNTTMIHLLHGLDPKGIGEYPFTPVTNEVAPVKAKDLGININPEAYIYSTASIAAYIGGDITSDLLASGIFEKEEKALLIDFGTNGEMVLSDGERVLTASSATGPAFEGAVIRCGMNGRAGAIEKYRIDPGTGESSFDVIGSGPAEGVCGSGLIDILAELTRNGIVSERGRLIEGSSRYVRKDEAGQIEYFIAGGRNGDLVLNDREISELVLAKGAMSTGIEICLKNMPLSTGDLDRIIVAGGFGKHINLENAIEIGLLPDCDRDKYEFMGNGSLKGAVIELLNRKKWAESRSIARQKAENLQLEQDPDFYDIFADSTRLG